MRTLLLAALSVVIAVAQKSVGVAGLELSVRTESDDPQASISRDGGSLTMGRARTTASRLLTHTFHRLVADKAGRVIFGYDIEVQRAPNPGQFFARLLPLDTAYEQRIRAEAWFPADSPLAVNGRLVTFERSKDLGIVKAGDEVRVELFRNPSTGGRIDDVLALAEHPLARPWPYLRRNAPEDLHLERIRVLVNGRDESSPDSSLSVTGKAVKIAIHPYGRFFFSAAPVAGYPFELIGRVEGKRLTVRWQGRVYEFVSEVDILTKPGPVSLWTLVLPAPASDPGSSVSSASDILRLLPPPKPSQ